MTLILNRLYLGGITDLTPMFLYNNNIKTIINVAKEYPAFSTDYEIKHGIEKYYFPIEDNNIDITNEVVTIAELIHNQLQKGAIFIHCRAGISRSATMVLAYLIIRLNFTLYEAYGFVRESRRILPNPYFMTQLDQLEQRILGTRSFNSFLDEYAVEFIMCSLHLHKSRKDEVTRLYLTHDKDIWKTIPHINRQQRRPPKCRSAPF